MDFPKQLQTYDRFGTFGIYGNQIQGWGCIIQIHSPWHKPFISNRVSFLQRAVKRKLSVNGWDTKEGVKSGKKTRNNENEDKITEESERKESSTSKFELTHLKRYIPLYRWI